MLENRSNVYAAQLSLLMWILTLIVQLKNQNAKILQLHNNADLITVSDTLYLIF